MDKADLLRHWRFRVHRVQHAHYEAARRYEAKHYWIGVPAITVGAVVGATIFLSPNDFEVPFGSDWLFVLLGLLSVSAAVLTSLQTFLDYKGFAERHKLSGARFADLKHKIEIAATFPAHDDLLKAELLSIEKSWERIREESPNVPSRLWRKIEKKMSLENDKELHPDFAKLHR